MKKILTVSMTLLALLLSCESESPAGPDGKSGEIPANGVFVINEGNFGSGNASLSFWNSENDVMNNNVFQTNNGSGLGDTGNSLTVFDTLCFIVVNNSNKIEVISTNTFKRVATIPITEGIGPRHFVIQDVSRGFVSNIASNNISVIDLVNFRELTSFDAGNNPEEFYFRGSLLFVTNSGFGSGNTISVIALSTSLILDSIVVGDSPEWIREARDGRLHVLCRGSYKDFNDPNDDTPGGIWVIDYDSRAVVDSLQLPKGVHPTELTLDNNGTGYFITADGIAKYNTDTVTMIDEDFIPGNFYHVQYDSVGGRLYALDAKDYIVPGDLLVFDDGGIELFKHEAGVIPGYIAFKKTTSE